MIVPNNDSSHFFPDALSSHVECNTIQFQLDSKKKKSVWLYDEPKNVSCSCLHVQNYEARSTENVRTRVDEVALNAKNAACCDGSQSLKRLAVPCLYANMGSRGQAQVRLPSLA